MHEQGPFTCIISIHGSFISVTGNVEKALFLITGMKPISKCLADVPEILCVGGGGRQSQLSSLFPHMHIIFNPDKLIEKGYGEHCIHASTLLQINESVLGAETTCIILLSPSRSGRYVDDFSIGFLSSKIPAADL